MVRANVSHASSSASTDPRRQRAAESVDVLLVEDDPVIREQLADALVDHGLRVCTAEHGRQALELLQRIRATVVVTDLVMPVMNGWELAEALGRQPGGPPILFLTAVGNVRGRHPGPLFLKPVHLDSLLRAIQNHLAQGSGS
jgi:DNA-binding response OmpR family regulator